MNATVHGVHWYYFQRYCVRYCVVVDDECCYSSFGVEVIQASGAMGVDVDVGGVGYGGYVQDGTTHQGLVQ